MSDTPEHPEVVDGQPPAVADSYFVTSGGGSYHHLAPGVEIRAVAGESLMISRVELAEGSVVPDHSHPHEQMGMLLSGRVEFTIGGVTRILEPGDIWRIPGHVSHRVLTLDGPAVALDLFHPVRDDYR